jgi:hypothetical protein
VFGDQRAALKKILRRRRSRLEKGWLQTRRLTGSRPKGKREYGRGRVKNLEEPEKHTTNTLKPYHLITQGGKMGAQRLVVIGGNAAGMSAASQARRRRKDLDITVFESGPHTSYAP